MYVVWRLSDLHSLRKRVCNVVGRAVQRAVRFCFGHKSLFLSVWYLEFPSNDVATKLQVTLFLLTSRLGAFFGFQGTLTDRISRAKTLKIINLKCTFNIWCRISRFDSRRSIFSFLFFLAVLFCLFVCLFVFSPYFTY